MIRIFRILVPASVFTLFLSEAVLIFACYTAAGYLNPETDASFFTRGGPAWERIGMVVCLILLSFYFRDLYRELRTRSRILLVQRLSVIMGIVFVAEALISYWRPDWALPLAIMIPGSALALGVIFMWRLLFNIAIRNAVGVRRVLFLGVSPAVIRIAGHLEQHPELGFAPVGYVDGAGAETGNAGVARLGPAANLAALIDQYRPDWIVASRREEISSRWIEELLELRFFGVHAEEAAGLYEAALGRVCALEIRPGDLIFSELLQPNSLNLNLQSIYSTAVAAALLLLALPAMAVIAALVKASSPGPVFLRERCFGQGGAPFTMYRFRWMREGGGRRATKLGKLLRRFGLDGLPALWNVVRGQMSLVGPRPDRPEFAARLNQMIPFYCERTAVKPGMTGLAQINDYGEPLVHDALKRIEYDLYYIKNLSTSLDIHVMLRWLRESLLSRDSIAA